MQVSIHSSVKAFSKLRVAFGREERSGSRVLTSIVLSSLAIRLVALGWVKQVALTPDALGYVEMARQIVSGQPFAPYWPPGLPLYLMPFVCIGASDWVLRLSMVFFWLLCCWGTLRLAAATKTSGIAWLILLVFSLLPDAIQLSIEPLTQMPVAALLLISLSSAVRIIQLAARGYDSALLGFALGAMALTRPSATPLLLLIPLCCFVATRRYVRSATAFSIGFAILSLWVVHTHTMTGRWVVNTANQKNMYLGNNPWTPLYRTWYFGSHAKPGTTEIHRFPEFEQQLKAIERLPAIDQADKFRRLSSIYISSHPGISLIRSVNRFLCFFAFDTFTAAQFKDHDKYSVEYAILACEALSYMALIGTSAFWISQASGTFWRNPANATVLSAVVIYSAPYWISMSHPTYHFPVLVPIAVAGATAWRDTDRRYTRRWLGSVVVGVFLATQAEWIWINWHAKN